MDSTEKQLTDMMKMLKSWSEAKVNLEWGSFAIILFFLFVGNFVTLLVMVLNRQMRTIPNLFVASLAISDFCLGAFSAFPLGFTVLATSQWRFSDSTCQYQGYMAVTLGCCFDSKTLTIMAMNRYFWIVKPAKYRRYFAKKKTKFLILVWRLYAMCSALP